MIRRNARLRREYLYRKSLEGKEREEYERKRKIRQALEGSLLANVALLGCDGWYLNYWRIDHSLGRDMRSSQPAAHFSKAKERRRVACTGLGEHQCPAWFSADTVPARGCTCSASTPPPALTLTARPDEPALACPPLAEGKPIISCNLLKAASVAPPRAEGKPIPTELRRDEAALRREVALEDDNTAVPRTHIDDEYAHAGERDPRSGRDAKTLNPLPHAVRLKTPCEDACGGMTLSRQHTLA